MTDQPDNDANAEVDAMVASIGPKLGAPMINRLDAVLVTGPWLSGVTGVVAALTERLPEQRFIESTDLAAGEAPTVVVFVVSAAAALTESDCALLDAAISETDAVIGVVSKIDVHRNWDEVLAANRDVLAAHAPRYRDVPWVGVAAAPEQGEPQVDDLVAAVSGQLANDELARRNRLRAWESRLQTVADRYDRDADGAGRRARVEALREERSAILRQRRLAKSERTIALRSQTQQARVQLSYFARNRCASVRSELQEDAAGLTRAKLPEFASYAGVRLNEVVAEVDNGTTTHLADVAQGLGLTIETPASAPLPRIDPPAPQLKSRKLESRLMMLVGAGFGLGVALTLSRLLAHLAPGLTIAGAVACAAIGLGLTVWVVGTRGLLRDRGLLDRWAGEATAWRNPRPSSWSRRGCCRRSRHSPPLWASRTKTRAPGSPSRSARSTPSCASTPWWGRGPRRCGDVRCRPCWLPSRRCEPSSAIRHPATTRRRNLHPTPRASRPTPRRRRPPMTRK